MSPLNRLKVRGILISGCTSIVTPFYVRKITCSFFCLFSGLSSRAKRHWCTMSGRTSPESLLAFASSFLWSSLFKSSTPRLVCAVSKVLTRKILSTEAPPNLHLVEHHKQLIACSFHALRLFQRRLHASFLLQGRFFGSFFNCSFPLGVTRGHRLLKIGHFEAVSFGS